jgi:hypothetical protein
MAGIKDAIRNYQNRGAGLPSPRLSPELLKALQVPENKGLGSVFPEETGYYDSFIKSIGGDPENPATELGKYASYPGKAIAYGAEGIISTLKGLGLSGDRISGSPLTDNLVSHLTSTPEETRQNLGQDILKQLSSEDRMQQGQLANKTSSTMGQGSGEYLDTRGQIGDTGIEAAIGDGNIDEDLIQEELKQKIAENTQLGDMSQEGADMEVITPEMRKPVVSEAEKLKNAQQSLFKNAMEDYNTTYGSGTTKDSSRKSIDDYKKDFAEATGIDVSGEPDNRMALMSLGLSLMQNRAGKGFNVSKILTSLGEAGDKAMPFFEKAKADARAGQVASGKYALQETKADSLASLATAKEKRKALSALSTQFRDQKFKVQIEYMKHNNNMAIKIAEANLKPIDAKGKVTTQTLQGNDFLKVDTAFVTGSRNRVFLAPVQQAEKHANMYVNVLEAQGSITEMQDILKSVGQKGGGSAFALLGGRVKEFLKPLGIGDTDYSKGIDEIVSDKNISAEAKVTAIQDRLISQYKKFLTKESGNGVSEGDIKRLQILVGKISLTAPFKENMARLDELAKIFKQPRTTLEGTFAEFGKRKNHMSDDSYKDTMNIINKAISTGTEDLYSSGFNDDGVFTIDLRKK